MHPVKRMRLMKGLRQLDLARELGMSESKISKIETGRQTLDEGSLRHLVTIFDVPEEDLTNPENLVKSNPEVVLYRRVNFEEVNRRALGRATELLSCLLPEGRLTAGREWEARNPKRNDQKVGSFLVNTHTGKWADFATDARGRDIIGLVAYLKDVPRWEAARIIEKMIGGQE